MSSFTNRKSSNLNKKILKVNDVTRDESGEITKLKVTEIRDDLPVSNEGTPLNAENMNRIINEMIGEHTHQIFDILIYHSLLTSSQVRDMDKSLLTLPSEVFKDFTLPSHGFCGSNISWNISNTSNNNAFTQDGNNIHVKRLSNDAYIYLVANIYKVYDEREQKNFTVVVKGITDDPDNFSTVNKYIDIIPYDVDVEDSDYECEELVNDTDVVVYNSHSSYVDVIYRIEDNHLYYCLKGKLDLSNNCFTSIQVKIRMDNNQNGNTMKLIDVLAFNTESTDPED